jgi:hypothetical protein
MVAYDGGMVVDDSEHGTDEREIVVVTAKPKGKKGTKSKAKTKVAAPKNRLVKEKTVEPFKMFGDLAAANRAIKEQTSVPTGHLFHIAIKRLVENHNYRDEPSNLAAMGYSLINKEDPDHSLVDMCLSADMDTVRSAVALFDEHEGTPSDNDDDAKVADKSTSIISLAAKFVQVGQLQPVCVRRLEGEDRALIFGQRRVAAAAYRHAKSRCQVADGVEGIKVIPATIKAIVSDVAAEDAWMMAVSENSDRKEDDPIQEGFKYARILKMVDPETDRKYTLAKTAELMNVNQNRVRSYQALTLPRDETKKRGLTDDDREAVRTKKKTVTWGIRRALNEKHYSEGEPQLNRGKAIPFKAMQSLFDDTAEINIVRRQAIAECMGFEGSEAGLAEATAQSEARIADQEEKKIRGKRKTVEEEEDAEDDD